MGVLSDFIVPNPVSKSQIDRNWDALRTIMDILEKFLGITYNETTKEYEAALTLNNLLITENLSVLGSLSATNIYCETLDAIQITSSQITSYEVQS